MLKHYILFQGGRSSFENNQRFPFALFFSSFSGRICPMGPTFLPEKTLIESVRQWGFCSSAVMLSDCNLLWI